MSATGDRAPSDGTRTAGRDDGARPRRRTQAERRAATRGGLLDATIEVLVDHGYAGLTTSLVCERAGVTRGAQAHYFATKAELVVAGLSHLTEQLAEQLVAEPLDAAEAPVEQYRVLLQRLWEIFSGPVSLAQLELWTAARTDPELRRHLVRFDKAVMSTLSEAAHGVAPGLADRAEFGSVMATALATIRGLQMVRAVASDRAVRRLWPPAREQLLVGLDGIAPAG
ncbi:TetR/AcrR family transcriptional regulator [Nocardioides sambongensis]|uniref:TetR/AcrR family transcriptional regulator n=1 Tax=Nocardioides sambongensis TaxID=2589074 RepID=UPI00112AE03D|nr:TetR/AcrR family transcriptional regulator [Nocardioides sambongensis]